MLLSFLFYLLIPTLSQCEKRESKDQTEIIQETVKLMLDFNRIPSENAIVPGIHSSKQSTSYMQDLYRTFVEEDGSDDGNIVRNIEPSVGKVDDQEVLIFDISHIGKEQIMRGEIHFHLRRRGVSRRRARALSARALCTNDYCTEAQYLHQLKSPSGDVLWDTTKALVETNALGGKQLVVRISRRNVRMRSYSEMVRKSAPFLLVFSRAENTIDAETVRREVEGARRRRRETEGYYVYHADETSTPSEKSQKEMESYRKNSFGLLKADNKGRKLRAHRRRKTPKRKDIWDGFGEDADDESEEKDNVKEETQTSNDIRVVLLGLDKQKKVCQRHSMVVDFVELGWQKFVLEPAYFEAGHCAGTCEYPLKKASNPSNHAVLQSLLMPLAEPVCCAPDKMESLTILYKDEYGRTTIKNFPKMIVLSCGCI